VSGLPIRVRITAAFALATAVVLVASGLFLYLRLSSHLALALDNELRLRTQDLAALVSQPHASLAGDSASRFVESGESFAQLISPDGHVLDSTQPLGRTRLLTAAELREAQRAPIYLDLQSVPGLNEPSRVLATAANRAGRRLILVVGATRQNNAETLASFRDELLVAGPVALILAAGIGYLLAGLSLRQVESMRRRAAAITAAKPGERLPVPTTGDELQRLGETLNDMLDRLEAAVARERDFVADAGHELRTPLALLRTELELAFRQAHTVDELREAVRSSSHEVERLSQLAEDLLLIASSDGGKLPLRVEPLAVDRLFASTASRFDWRAEELGKTVTASAAPGVRVAGDRLRLEQALANLVDNALRYGGDEIGLRAVTKDDVIELHVTDNGAGFPDDYLPRAFERFTRADAARGRGGAGLGLSIARTIAESHGGTSNVANTGTIGADAWLSLAAPDEARQIPDGSSADEFPDPRESYVESDEGRSDV
jgi:two-component system OmpR family sensor kinase